MRRRSLIVLGLVVTLLALWSGWPGREGPTPSEPGHPARRADTQDSAAAGELRAPAPGGTREIEPTTEPAPAAPETAEETPPPPSRYGDLPFRPIVAMVVDMHTGLPIPGAAALIPAAFELDVPSESEDRHQLVRADAHGRLSFGYRGSVFRAGLRCRAEGYVELTFDFGRLTRPADHFLRLIPSAALDVTVVDRGGAPLRDLTVRLTVLRGKLDPVHPAERILTGPTEWKAVTGDDGRCSFDALPAEVGMDVWLDRGGRPQLRLDERLLLAAGENAERRWTLAEGGSITGTITDQLGLPLADLSVLLCIPTLSRAHVLDRFSKVSQRARTDADGRYRFDAVPAGPWWVGPHYVGGTDLADGERFSPIAQRVELEHGAGVLVVDIVVQRGLYISGRVVEPDGTPGRPPVRIYARGFGGDFTTKLDEDGRWRVGPLGPGEYRVKASAPRREDVTPGPELRVEAGAANLLLELLPGGLLTTEVLSSSGTPVNGKARLVPREGQGYRNKRFSGGELRIGGVAPGSYDLVLTAGEELAVVPRVEVPGELPPRIVLAPAAFLHLVTDREFLVVHATQGDVQVLSQSLWAGKPQRVVVPSGPGVLRSAGKDESGEWSWELEIDAVAGETLEVRVNPR